jgi:hypothetical protein
VSGNEGVFAPGHDEAWSPESHPKSQSKPKTQTGGASTESSPRMITTLATTEAMALLPANPAQMGRHPTELDAVRSRDQGRLSRN